MWDSLNYIMYEIRVKHAMFTSCGTVFYHRELEITLSSMLYWIFLLRSSMMLLLS